MRPPEFTGGNPATRTCRCAWRPRFNEAAGIHRRKLLDGHIAGPAETDSFNEAAGIHRRKRRSVGGRSRYRWVRFNEAAGIHRRKPPAVKARMQKDFEELQ